MRLRTVLAASTALIALPVAAQTTTTTPSATTQVDTSTPADAAANSNDAGEVVVTARKREETLLDVPVAATALSGTLLENRGINSVREAASLTPGLNINSDGAGRAFVSIRGVGVTLVSTVQPGVGLFIDGIYQPNTSYLNNPLLDVARIEVLRGPQGTLYGKNTLGGAINVITRQPTNTWEGRALASIAGPDDQYIVSGAISGPIVADMLQFRVAASHREQDGFIRNTILGIRGNPLNTDSVNGTLRFTPSPDVVLTLKGYYDSVNGVNTPYARVAGPTDYKRTDEFNSPSRVHYKYRGVNARLELPLDALSTKLTLIGAYDGRDGSSPDSDADFGRVNAIRSVGSDRLRTTTTEARFDSKWSDQFSSLVGLFYSRETLRGADVTNIIPFGLTRFTTDSRRGDTYAAFGTIFWQPSTAWEVSAGLRYDHESRRASGTVRQAIGATTISNVIIPEARLKSNEWQPKLSITRHWSPELMTYASVARGYRGGGFNAPTAPTRTYKGDSAWTYELGTKFASSDRRLSLSGALFYNDYKDYIGLNSIAPAAGGGLVTVDLNSGDVESYGAELEGFVKPTTNWTISGGLTLMHARLTNFDAYTRTTGRVLPSNRLTFQPDVTANLYSDYKIPVGDDTLTLTGGFTHKGKRLAGTLNQTTPTFLKGYTLANASITYQHGPLELSLFANNIFNKRYFDSYIEKTTLLLAGLTTPIAAPATDLGIVGDSRRYGVRASFKF